MKFLTGYAIAFFAFAFGSGWLYKHDWNSTGWLFGFAAVLMALAWFGEQECTKRKEGVSDGSGTSKDQGTSL